jgi:hypothetical protein
MIAQTFRSVVCGPIFLALAALGTGIAWGQAPEEPETVLLTYHPKMGAEDRLLQAIRRHWRTAERLKLVVDAPHVVVRGSDGDERPYFVEVFTWRDGSIPDAAPAEILACWSEINKHVESRGVKPGVDIAVVTLADEVE